MTKWALVLSFFLTQAACSGQPDTGKVGFVLIRADEMIQDPALRAGGVDRDHVVQVACEITDANGVVLVNARADVDPEALPGTQEVILVSVPQGQGYFARIIGLDASSSVYECGATGPFSISAGSRLFIEIVIDQPGANDPACQALCQSHDDCDMSSYCPSPCVRPGYEGQCTEALCRFDALGMACSTKEDCGAGYACVTVGYPGGYCTASCQEDYTCPGRAICDVSSSPGVCTRVCSDDSDCRTAEGYACRALSIGGMGCQPPFGG